MNISKQIDLESDQLKLLKTIINHHIPNKTVWAYGSRVNWNANDRSDLDLAVFDCNSTQIFDLKEALEESDLLISVDVLDWNSIPKSFKENIKKKYVVLQEKDKLNGWREVKLGDVVRLNSQNIGKEYAHEVIQYLDTGSITNGQIENLKNYYLSEAPTRAKRLVENNDIVYSNVRPIQRHYGYIRNPPDNLVVSTGFTVIQTEQSLAEPLFIYYQLISNDVVKELDVIAEGTTSIYPALNPSDIENLKILLPPLSEQKAIAEVLSSLDDKIDLLHRQNKTLESLAQTLFRQWFVEEVSNNWREGIIPDEFDLTMGQSPPGHSYNEQQSGIPIFQGNADFGFRFPSNRIYTTEPKRFAKKFDTLVSVRAPVGEQNMAKEKCCIGRGVAAFRFQKDNSFYTYTYYKIQSLLVEIKQYNNTGTVFGSINKDNFNNLKITVPPNEIVRKFEDMAKPINEQIYANHSQIQTLQVLLNTLLPNLMSNTIQINHRVTDK